MAMTWLRLATPPCIQGGGRVERSRRHVANVAMTTINLKAAKENAAKVLNKNNRNQKDNQFLKVVLASSDHVTPRWQRSGRYLWQTARQKEESSQSYMYKRQSHEDDQGSQSYKGNRMSVENPIEREIVFCFSSIAGMTNYIGTAQNLL